MKKIVILLILLATVIFTAGCADENQDNSTDAAEVQESNGTVVSTESDQNNTPQEGNVVNLTDLGQINTSLQQGPVLVKIGSEHCGPCKAMEPILQELATEYAGRATIISIDMEKNPLIAVNYFGAGYVPDSTVIVSIKDGEYVYMHPEGYVTTNRFEARITGLREKDIYEDVLNFALLQTEKDKSQ